MPFFCHSDDRVERLLETVFIEEKHVVADSG